jgi:hypothetical protein
LVTLTPDGFRPRWLSQEGAYDGLKMSWATPGGCNAMSFTFRKPPLWRSDALNPGRQIHACRGTSWCWRGILDEPTPATDGWSVTAHGAGGFSDDYLALYSVSWGVGVFDDAVDQAIARGLDWVRPATLNVSGVWAGQQVDSGAQTITNLLDLACNKGGLTWVVATTPSGNLVQIIPLPTRANRLIVAGNPESRSIDSGASDLYIRYQATTDKGKTPAAYATTLVSNTADRTAHGRRELLMDISSAGPYTAGQAQAVGNAVLARWQRIGFADPFVVAQGELLTLGGQEIDLGTYWADGITAMVCKLWLADFSYGGENTPGAPTFLVGGYEYDEDGDQATITPFASARHDFPTLLQAAIDATPVRTAPVVHHRKKRHKRRA